MDSLLDSSDSVATTRGIRIEAKPTFNAQHSNLEAAVYVYSYQITITNENTFTVQLVSRHWIIRDGFDKVEQVVGEGVVGQKPILKPGETYSYSSFCPLKTPTGTMQGTFQMKGPKDEVFEAIIGEFKLRAQELLN